MDTLTRPTAAELAVNKDIVESVVACAGYNRRNWAMPVALTAFNGAAAGLLLVPQSWLAAGALWLLGAVCVLWMLGMQADHQSMTLSMRNALERRFGLPEYARHRSDYSPFWDGE